MCSQCPTIESGFRPPKYLYGTFVADARWFGRPDMECAMGIKTALKKATRKVEKAITGEEPEVDILDTLAEEHEVVAALLEELVDGKSSAQRASTLKQIKKNLVPHARAEEAVLYSAILRVKDKPTKTDGEEGFVEHGLIDVLLKNLSGMRDKMSPRFGATAKVLKEIVTHHVREEESDVWSDAKENFPTEQRQKMNRTYVAKKKLVKIPA
jgi:hemerythrin superfamily protein